MPRRCPEKGPIRRFGPSAAGGAETGKIKAKPREECTDFGGNLSFSPQLLTILQTGDFRRQFHTFAQFCKIVLSIGQFTW